jgi:hypothetical protein
VKRFTSVDINFGLEDVQKAVKCQVLP